MSRLNGILAAALLVLGIVAVILLRETTAARTHNEQLMARVAALESARGASVPLPVAASADLPSVADAADQP